MRINLILFIFSLANLQPIFSQPPTIQWQKCLGGTNGEEGRSIQNTPDGGYLIAGNALSNDGDVSGQHGTNYFDYWAVKLDVIGNIIWQKCYGGTGIDILNSMILTADSGFIMAGSTDSNDGDVIGINSYTGDYWVVKCDSIGTLQWQKCLGGSVEDLAYKIIRSLNGGYMVVGMSFSTDFDVTGSHWSTDCGWGCTDAWLAKIDSVGNMQWGNCYGGTWSEAWNSILATADSGYVLAGYTRSDDGDVLFVHGGTGSTGGRDDYWIIKINSTGVIEWQKSLGGTNDEIPADIIRTFDGGYIVTGSALSDDFDVIGQHFSGREDAWVVKLDSIGNLEWQKCLGGTEFDYGSSIIQVADSSYIVLCSTNSNNGDVSGNHSSTADVWLVKLDQSGNVEWQKCIGGFFPDAGYDIQQTSDGGFVFTGITGSNDGDVSGNHGNYDVWVVKLSPLPNGIATNTSPITDFTTNLDPINSVLHLSFYANGNENVNVQLIDIAGRLFLQNQFTATNGFNKHQVFTGDLVRGIYFVRLITKGGNVTKKLVIQ